MGRISQPQPGEVIFDMCAAPGGKTTHIATLMNNTGRIFAADRSKRRAQSLKSLCERWGLDCVSPLFLDSASCISDSPDPKGKRFCRESFDRILLDGPCSGIGLRPKFQEEKSLEEILGFEDYQRKREASSLPFPSLPFPSLPFPIPFLDVFRLMVWQSHDHTISMLTHSKCSRPPCSFSNQEGHWYLALARSIPERMR